MSPSQQLETLELQISQLHRSLNEALSELNETYRYAGEFSSLDSKVGSLLSHLSIMIALCVFFAQESKGSVAYQFFLVETIAYCILAYFCLYLLKLNLIVRKFVALPERLNYNPGAKTMNEAEIELKKLEDRFTEAKDLRGEVSLYVKDSLKRVKIYTQILGWAMLVTALFVVSVIMKILSF